MEDESKTWEVIEAFVNKNSKVKKPSEGFEESSWEMPEGLPEGPVVPLMKDASLGPSSEGPVVPTPVQYVPPPMGFDEVYLYPTQRWEETIEEHKRAFREQQAYHRAETQRANAEERLKRNQAMEAEAAAQKAQAEAAARLESTRRQNEQHSQETRDKERLLKNTQEKNEDLEKRLGEARHSAEEARKEKKQTAQRVENLFWNLCKAAAAICLILCVVTGRYTYRAGFAKGHKAEVIAENQTLLRQNEKLTEEKYELEVKNHRLSQRVHQLTPPLPPPIDVPAVEATLQSAYAKMDQAHDQEATERFFRHYARKYIHQTNHVRETLGEVRNYTRTAFFRPDVFHQQLTAQVKPSTPLKEDGEKADSNDGVKEGAEEKNSTSSFSVKVINVNKVTLPIIKTIYKWEKEVDEEGRVTREGVKIVIEAEDTWERHGEKWLLARTEVQSVNEMGANRSFPTMKCSRLSCGEYYSKGIHEPFREDGTVIKRCPKCRDELYFVDHSY